MNISVYCCVPIRESGIRTILKIIDDHIIPIIVSNISS